MMSSDLSEGAKAEPNSKTEYAMISIIRVTRRPKRSAIIPNRKAPTGRMAKVRKIASATAEIFA
jgi:hypothetical protein